MKKFKLHWTDFVYFFALIFSIIMCLVYPLDFTVLSLSFIIGYSLCCLLMRIGDFIESRNSKEDTEDVSSGS